MTSAMALWLDAPREAVLRDTPYGVPEGGVEVATLWSGISRGTERLVFEGRVPEAEAMRMRAPMQEGSFGFPVKYGYAAVGRVVAGEPSMLGRTVFALAPHQARFGAEAGMVHPLPDGLPPSRAVMAANMETALNVIWDAGAGPGDRIAVVGAGVVGALVGYLAARLPGAEVELIDVNPARAALAEALGCRFAEPEAAEGGADVVIHASATAAGLATALALAGAEAVVVEASWYGAGEVAAPLGAAFHSQRLTLRASQVGAIPPARAPRWSHARRMAKALDLLTDPVLEALISGQSDFSELALNYSRLLDDPATLCHVVRYPDP